MTITGNEIYWITRLDCINKGIVLCQIVILLLWLGTIILYITYPFVEDNKVDALNLKNKLVKWIIILAIIGIPITLLNIFLPSGKEILEIKKACFISNQMKAGEK